MDEIRLKARAKINLGLDVLRRREDGYHEVKMVMQTVDLFDDLSFRKLEEDCILVSTDKEELAGDESNLVYKAVKLVKDTFGIRRGVAADLTKRIPMAAGMAGGSADAAAAIHGMDRLFSLGLSLEEKQKLGVKIGADVPYCIMRGTVLAEGIGEKLTVLPPMPKCTVLIAKPPVSVSTKTVYEALDAQEITVHPDIDGIIAGLEKGDVRAVASSMGNVLEGVTIPMHPVIAEIKKEMTDAGALGAMMSGSGPTVFGLFDNRAAAKAAQRRIREKALTKQVYVTNIHSVRRK